jgi:hypothetical protein
METGAFYIESSLPDGLTLAQYRRLRPKRRRRRVMGHVIARRQDRATGVSGA